MTNAIPTDITVLKQLIALRLDVNIWSARKKLTPADFGTLDLPPEKLASLGSKKVCNPEDLRVFATLKARATALLDRHGVRFLGGWAIPENAVKPVSEGLKAIATDFAAAKESFLARYDQAIQEWVSNNPGWESLIARSLVGIDTVRARLGFAWQMFKVVPPKGLAGQSLTEAVNTLGGSLFGEVAKVADEAWHKSFAGKAEVTAKALSPIKSLRHKLAGLSFVEPRVTPLVDLIDAALAAVPDKGPITGTALVGLQGLVCLLRDPAAMIEHGQRIIEGQSPNDALLGLGTLPAADHAPAIDADSFPDFSDDDLPPDLPMEPASRLDSLGLW